MEQLDAYGTFINDFMGVGTAESRNWDSFSSEECSDIISTLLEHLESPVDGIRRKSLLSLHYLVLGMVNSLILSF